MPFGGAYRMSGFGEGFGKKLLLALHDSFFFFTNYKLFFFLLDGYLGLGRNVDFNETKIHSSASGGNYKNFKNTYLIKLIIYFS